MNYEENVKLMIEYAERIGKSYPREERGEYFGRLAEILLQREYEINEELENLAIQPDFDQLTDELAAGGWSHGHMELDNEQWVVDAHRGEVRIKVVAPRGTGDSCGTGAAVPISTAAMASAMLSSSSRSIWIDSSFSFPGRVIWM